MSSKSMLGQPMFPPPVPFEPPVAFTTASVGKTITPDDSQQWLNEIHKRKAKIPGGAVSGASEPNEEDE